MSLRMQALLRRDFDAGIVGGHYLVADLPTAAHQRVVDLNRR